MFAGCYETTNSTKGQCEHENGMIEKIYNDLKVEFVYYAPRQVAIDKKKCLKYLGPFKNSLILPLGITAPHALS